MPERTYHPGGYIQSELQRILLDPAECIIAAASLKAGDLRCGRRDEDHLNAAHRDRK